MSLHKEKQQLKFAALVLAADRTASDPITLHTGAACKAFAKVGGEPMIIRVLDTLAACDQISGVVLCGPPEARLEDCPPLKQRIDAGEVVWLPNGESPSRSAECCLNHLSGDIPVLLTTADHALLTPQIVHHFLTESLKTDADATVGVVTDVQMSTAFPDAKRTVFRLRDGGFCGCNLFTFKPQGRELVHFWRQVEDLRKKPWQLIAQIVSPAVVLSYVFGRLSLEHALDILATKSGVRVKTIVLPDPRAGIDVDKVEDLLLAESIVNKAPVSFFQRDTML